MPFGTAYGATVAYRVIGGADGLDRMPAPGRAEVLTTADRYRTFITNTLYDDPHMVAIRRDLTVEPLASVLAADPAGDR